MFGTLRFFLALLVVQGHIWPELASWTGVYSVYSFYILSGYLMALVLDRTYPFTVAGTRSFLLNRALRIYPPYLLVVVATIPLMIAYPEVFARLNDAVFYLPESLDAWLRNFAIFGLNIHVQGHGAFTPRLVPPGWSLDTELCFYLLMALGLGRGPRIARVWFVASVGFVGWAAVTGASWPERFLPLQAASLPFSLGALLYHYQDRLPRMGFGHVALAAALFVGNLVFAVHIAVSMQARFLPFYLSVATSVYLIAALRQVDPGRLPAALRRADRGLGDLSYPVFLAHWLAAALVSLAGLPGGSGLGPTLFAYTAVVVIGLAWGIHGAVEVPLVWLRDRLRARAKAGSAEG